jgi:hypothetical protein
MTKLETLEEVYLQAKEYLEACAAETEVARAVAINAYRNYDNAIHEEIVRRRELGETE